MSATEKLDPAMQTFVTNIEARTGKTIDELVTVARTGAATHREMIKLIQTQFGLTYGYANFIALQARAAPTSVAAGDGDGLTAALDAQYTGAKAALRPIYDTLAEIARGFGEDVEFAPKKAYVSLRRRKQFGCIHPTTATRVDLGLNLKGAAPTGRLEAYSDGMFSHRVRVNDVSEIDAEVIGWLKRAYDAS